MNWCWFLLASALLANAPPASPLLERLGMARNGDFTVLETGKTVTLLAVRAKTDHSLILEEISVPSNALKTKPTSWAEWIKSHAPGHTSWSMIEIDLKNREILECYSFSKSAWISLNKEHFLVSLLELPLQLLPLKERRKIGPQPQEGEVDRRAIWNPPLVIEGKKMDHALFDVFHATWPQDGSDLSGQAVSLYFDVGRQSLIPSWVQVDTAHASGSMRAIDSGRNLPAVHRTFPRRVPQFIGAPIQTTNGVRLSLKSPKYYKTFELFAFDITEKDKQLYPLNHTLVRTNEEAVTLEVSIDELEQILQPEHKYTWLVVPSGHSESYIESLKSFTWTPRG